MMKIKLNIDDMSGLDFKIGGVLFKMIYVEGGKYIMGAQNYDVDNHNYDINAYPDEDPINTVEINSFYMGQTPVTQMLWKKVMGYNPSANKSFFKNTDSYPVDCISWNDSLEFIAKLNAITQKHFRLPTEAEWEYAAKGGSLSKGYLYSGSDDVENVGWCRNNAEDSLQKVMTKHSNELGLYDMSGNVWEWCYDVYDYYDGTGKNTLLGHTKANDRVLRGGSWRSEAVYCRNTMRNSANSSYRFMGVGLRLAIDIL